MDLVELNYYELIRVGGNDLVASLVIIVAVIAEVLCYSGHRSIMAALRFQ